MKVQNIPHLSLHIFLNPPTHADSVTLITSIFYKLCDPPTSCGFIERHTVSSLSPVRKNRQKNTVRQQPSSSQLVVDVNERRHSNVYFYSIVRTFECSMHAITQLMIIILYFENFLTVFSKVF